MEQLPVIICDLVPMASHTMMMARRRCHTWITFGKGTLRSRWLLLQMYRKETTLNEKLDHKSLSGHLKTKPTRRNTVMPHHTTNHCMGHLKTKPPTIRNWTMHHRRRNRCLKNTPFVFGWDAGLSSNAQSIIAIGAQWNFMLMPCCKKINSM